MIANGSWFLSNDYQAWWNTSSTLSTWPSGYAISVAGIVLNITIELQRAFVQNNLTAIIYPEQTHLVVPIGSRSQSGRNGILAGVTGYPVICIPAGWSPAIPLGVPIGLEILTQPWTEGTLLDLADSIETLLNNHKVPQVADVQVPVVSLQSVPVITPNRTLPAGYHLGPL